METSAVCVDVKENNPAISIIKQECIPVGCVPSAVVAISQGGVSSGGCLLQRGVCSRWGCLLWGGVCSGGCLLQVGGVCSREGCLLRGVCSWGVCVSHHALRQTPPCGQTDACQNITFAISLRTVIIVPKQYFRGNKYV